MTTNVDECPFGRIRASRDALVVACGAAASAEREYGSRSLATAAVELGLLDEARPCQDMVECYVVALAELAGAVLVTGDERMTAAPGTRCDIQLVK